MSDTVSDTASGVEGAMRARILPMNAPVLDVAAAGRDLLARAEALARHSDSPDHYTRTWLTPAHRAAALQNRGVDARGGPGRPHRRRGERHRALRGGRAGRPRDRHGLPLRLGAKRRQVRRRARHPRAARLRGGAEPARGAAAGRDRGRGVRGRGGRPLPDELPCEPRLAREIRRRPARAPRRRRRALRRGDARGRPGPRVHRSRRARSRVHRGLCRGAHRAGPRAAGSRDCRWAWSPRSRAARGTG